MNKVVPDASFSRLCDLKTDQFVLQPDRLNTSTPLKGKLTNCHSSGCERPFSVQKIPHSNLILLVVDTLCPCGSKQLDITPQEVTNQPGMIALIFYLLWLLFISDLYMQRNLFCIFHIIISNGTKFPNFTDESLPVGECNTRRLSKERLHRKRPNKCINYHPEEIEIQQCGGAAHILGTSIVFVNLFVMWIISRA